AARVRTLGVHAAGSLLGARIERRLASGLLLPRTHHLAIAIDLFCARAVVLARIHRSTLVGVPAGALLDAVLLSRSACRHLIIGLGDTAQRRGEDKGADNSQDCGPDAHDMPPW